MENFIWFNLKTYEKIIREFIIMMNTFTVIFMCNVFYPLLIKNIDMRYMNDMILLHICSFNYMI